MKLPVPILIAVAFAGVFFAGSTYNLRISESEAKDGPRIVMEKYCGKVSFVSRGFEQNGADTSRVDIAHVRFADGASKFLYGIPETLDSLKVGSFVELHSRKLKDGTYFVRTASSVRSCK